MRDADVTDATDDGSAGSLDVLLIEDNPGDARLIREMLATAEELGQRVAPGGSETATTEPVVDHETQLEDGLEHLESASVDVILLDLNLPDSKGLETLRETLATVEWTPIVVLTGVRDQEIGLQAIEQGAQDYLVKDEVTDELLIRSIQHAIERNRQKRDRERRRQQLASLNRLNEINQDVIHDVITTSSRAELEQHVCDRLVEAERYRFAWIGQLERGGTEIVPTASAGVSEGYLEEVTITADEGDTGAGPAGTAVRTGEVQIASDIETDPDFEPWRDRALERGFRSSATIPITHEGLRYGILNVYADRPNAFTGAELEVLAGLGDIIGHAIAAIERKDALVSDSALELEFRLEGVAEELIALADEGDGTVQVEQLHGRENAIFAYGTASDLPREEFQEVAADTSLVDGVRLLTGGYDEFEFEAKTTAGLELVDTLAAQGGRLASATIDDGEFRFVATVPHGADARQLIDAIEEHCPAADHVAQRTVTRTADDLLDYQAILENLTEKQREALEVAVYAGYFDWPRASTAEEIAERLDITSATFTQHLRAAERQFFETVFDR
ncbi:bacterio-opsin activator domain-containing protein [Natrialbaceae archaeon AArc-T1-2]|uniref:bacterio-opsin activator domain-containing protein n=1 Tax=Natrialbaceae archaeon AArc-T1-2 TaxID=3053904 RepID=UPI00255B34FA|nr:bacterio-opsin activator domain-containing protein [Natrialbaceae archaeon AArc-T1-2]WIV66523.1 bacterio-opsin activator domain-containing protein [Natrialbaceae archaeon AArc-T1-2]